MPFSPEIPSDRLTLDDVPRKKASYEEIQDFAKTFDGLEHWGSFNKCARIVNDRRHSTLDELRTCLFFEFRRWHHFGYFPDEEAMKYTQELMAKIRNKIETMHRD